MSTLNWVHTEILYFIFCLSLGPLCVPNCGGFFFNISFRLNSCFLWLLHGLGRQPLISPTAEGSHFYLFPTFKYYSEGDYCKQTIKEECEVTYLLLSAGRKLNKETRNTNFFSFQLCSVLVPKSSISTMEKSDYQLVSLFFLPTNQHRAHTDNNNKYYNCSQNYVSIRSATIFSLNNLFFFF